MADETGPGPAGADYARRVTDLEQSRLLATPIPGPRSDRTGRCWKSADGVEQRPGVAMPVYCQRAAGGILGTSTATG